MSNKQRIGELVGGDYFVLPSSIHEVLILPDKGNMSTKDLVEMVKAVNESQVKREEHLGNRVMHYRADQNRLSVAVGLYFFLKPRFGTETVSWMCILGAAPFAAMGFVTWHGMTAEKFLWPGSGTSFWSPAGFAISPTICTTSF